MIVCVWTSLEREDAVRTASFVNGVAKKRVREESEPVQE